MTITVYKVKNNVNNKVLIGKTRKEDTVLTRLRSKLADKNREHVRADFKQLFLTHRETIVFELDVVAVLSNDVEARELRKTLIATTDNYNAVKKKGKESPGYIHTKKRGTPFCPECGGPKQETSMTCWACYMTSDRFKNKNVGIPKSEEAKRKQSIALTGRKRPELSKPIFAYGDFYPSLTQAGKATGVSLMTLSNRAKAPTCIDVYYLEDMG